MTDNFLNINNNIKSSKIKNVFTGIFAYIIALIILAFFMMQSVRNVLANDINTNYISQNEEIFEIANELSPDTLNVDRLILNRLFHQTPDFPDKKNIN